MSDYSRNNRNNRAVHYRKAINSPHSAMLIQHGVGIAIAADRYRSERVAVGSDMPAYIGGQFRIEEISASSRQATR